MANTLAAIAASLSAAVSLLALVIGPIITRRAEQQKWIRDALTEGVDRFLEASFESSTGIGRRARARAAGDTAAVEEYDRDAKEAYAQMRSLLTRVRLLGGAELGSAASVLREYQRAAYDADDAAGPTALAAVSDQRKVVLALAMRQLGSA